MTPDFVYIVIGEPLEGGGAATDSEYVEQVYTSEANARKEAADLNSGPSAKDWHFRVDRFVVEDSSWAISGPPLRRPAAATRGALRHD